MKPLRPRALVHRGVVWAAGFHFDAATLGAGETRRRVLARWAPGAVAYELRDAGVLLRLPAPVRVACDAAPGTPLVAREGVLVAAPLDRDEAAALAPSAGAAVLVREGACVVVRPDARALLDPAAWLDAAAFVAVDAATLGEVPPAIEVLDPSPSEVRAVFRDAVPAPPPAMAAVMAAIGRARREGRTAPASDAAGGPRGLGWLAVLAAAFGALVARVRARSAARRAVRTVTAQQVAAQQPAPYRGASASPSSAAGEAAVASGAPAAHSSSVRPASAAQAAPVPRAPSPSPSARVPREAWMAWMARMMRELRAMAARWTLASRLGRWIGARQAEYLAQMVEMFERGDLDRALHHAIPLSDKDGSDAVPSLAALAPRKELRIDPKPAASSGAALGLGEDLFARLQRLYRAAFERLAREGKIEQAAFVLAELLRASEEAVAFLEQHKRFRLAAEVAEARGLPAGLVVRQWFLAGEIERAVRVARRTGAFADAVLRLERSDPARAEALRVLWAESLADAGDYAAAVDVLWPVKSARVRAAEWVDRAIARGGVAGARMLARKMALFPEASVGDAVVALLDDADPVNAPARAAFADRLDVALATPAVRAFARAAARALLRDLPFAGDAGALSRIDRVVALANDGALRADVPTVAAPVLAPIVSGTVPRRIERAADDRGALAVLDVAWLPDGRVAVALGEAGLRVLTRDGRTVAHFDEPAHRLVVSDHGDRALLLAPRGEAWRVARAHLLERRAEHWCDVRLDAFATTFDGSLWFVSADDAVLAVDATAPAFGALWRVGDVGTRAARSREPAPEPAGDGAVLALARSASRCSVLVAGAPGERWSFELPALTLRERASSAVSVHSARWGTVAPGGAVAAWALNAPDVLSPPTALSSTGLASAPRSAVLGLAVEREGELVATDLWVLATVASDAGTRVCLLDAAGFRVRLEVTLGGATRAVARVQDTTLVLADDRGRVLALDLVSGRLLCDVRV